MDLDNILKILQILVIPAFYVGYKWVRAVEATITENKTDAEKKIDFNKADADKVLEKHRTDNNLMFQEHDLRLKAVEELTKYLVEAGKNLKDQQAAMNLTVNSIQIAIVEMNKNIEKVILKLDKYDENITHFYRDYDLKHKPEKS